MRINIGLLGQESGVKFGTSGARGLAVKMTDLVCYAYTRSFIGYLEKIGDLKQGSKEPIAIGGDLRESTPRILGAVLRAISDAGYKAIYCGTLPTPALFYYGFENGMPSIMVTGSHIPFDRNGIKYHKKAGEILKVDEAKMKETEIEIDENIFDSAGNLKSRPAFPKSVEKEAIALFSGRYTRFFAGDILRGMKVALYEHSAVGRDMLAGVLKALGAEVLPVGRSASFIPLDTEAVSEENLCFFRKLSKDYVVDAVVSTDGDSDRPLVCDERGEFVRGDVLGILVAKFLGAKAVVTTASANSAVEESGFFKHVSRTKIGSPYVVAEMMELGEKFDGVVGYESNGGFLLQTAFRSGTKTLNPLPSRDSFLPILCALSEANLSGKRLSALVARLPARFTFSERIENTPTEKSAYFIKNHFETGDASKDAGNAEELFGQLSGDVDRLEKIDGVRIIFKNKEVVHIRPSGNAPELRVYSEAGKAERAEDICKKALKIISEKIRTEDES